MRNIRENMTDKSKIWLIYDEFNRYNEDVDEKDLLKAAQDLIDLSKSEYVHKNEIDRKDRLSFQNCDLVDAFTKYEDRIFKSEYPKHKSELIEEKEAISIRRFKHLNKLGN